jgi:type IV pilus assembly protein PilN
MIEINLLPGTGKKPRNRGGAGINFSGVASGLASKVNDPLLLSAVTSVLVAALVIGGMFWHQRAQSTQVNESLQKAEQDSINYSGVIREQRKAQSQRDSVVSQVNLIKSFDDKRFVWPHLMEEVSRALPPYTWVTSMVQTNTITTAQAAPPPTTKGGKAGPPAVDSSSVPRVQFRVVGNTVDIQALTRFMKVLESSPFIENVQLERSSIILVDGKEVTEFALSAAYQTPDPSSIKTVPVTLSVR